MALSVPTTTLMNAWTTAQDAAAWAGVTAEDLSRISECIGDPQFTSLLLLASVDDEDWAEVRKQAGLSIVKKAAANLMFAAVKAKFNACDR